MARILVLARNHREAGSYAALMGFPRNSFRAVQKAGSIRGVRNAEVHILPSFLTRRDRHGILAALRNTRMSVFYVDPADFDAASEPATDLGVGIDAPSQLSVGGQDAQAQVDALGEVTDEQLDEAYRLLEVYNENLRELADVADDPAVTEAVEARIALNDDGKEAVSEEKRTRRKKCPNCDELFPKEEYAAHLATHVAPGSSYFD